MVSYATHIYIIIIYKIIINIQKNSKIKLNGKIKI